MVYYITRIGFFLSIMPGIKFDIHFKIHTMSDQVRSEKTLVSLSWDRPGDLFQRLLHTLNITKWCSLF